MICFLHFCSLSVVQMRSWPPCVCSAVFLSSLSLILRASFSLWSYTLSACQVELWLKIAARRPQVELQSSAHRGGLLLNIQFFHFLAYTEARRRPISCTRGETNCTHIILHKMKRSLHNTWLKHDCCCLLVPKPDNILCLVPITVSIRLVLLN